MYNQANFYLLTWNQCIQHKSIHTLSNRMLPIYRYLFSFRYLFWNMFNSKAIKIHCIIIIHILNYPMSFYWFILITIYYICPILYFRYIIYGINTIIHRFILTICYISKFEMALKILASSNFTFACSIVPLPANRFSNKPSFLYHF